MKISFDFDETLADTRYGAYGGEYLVAIPKFVDLLREWHAMGCECIILTARSDQPHYRLQINQFLEDHDLSHIVTEVHFTGHEPKGPFAEKLGVCLHYDDSDTHLRSCRKHNIIAISSKE